MRGKTPHSHRWPESDLPIVDNDEDDDFDDDDEDDDDVSEDDEPLELEIDTEPRTVLITGACGNIGRKLRAAWEDVYDLILLDAAADEDDPEVFKVDLSELDEEWITHFHGVDTVVHLAANSNELCVARRIDPAQHRRHGQRVQRRGARRRRPHRLRQLEPCHGRLQGRG